MVGKHFIMCMTIHASVAVVTFVMFTGFYPARLHTASESIKCLPHTAQSESKRQKNVTMRGRRKDISPNNSNKWLGMDFCKTLRLNWKSAAIAKKDASQRWKQDTQQILDQSHNIGEESAISKAAVPAHNLLQTIINYFTGGPSMSSKVNQDTWRRHDARCLTSDDWFRRWSLGTVEGTKRQSTIWNKCVKLVQCGVFDCLFLLNSHDLLVNPPSVRG